MIAFFCEDDLLAEGVLRVLSDVPICHAKCRTEFAGMLRLADLALAVVPDLRDADKRMWIRDTNRRSRHIVWVLLTHPHPENVVHLVGFEPTVRIVWLDGIEHTLPPIVRKISRTDFLDHVVRFLTHAQGTPSELALALEQIAGSPRPPRTVAGLGSAVGLPEHRLRYLWTRDKARGGSLKELVDWVVLAWSLRLKATLGSWDRVATELGIKEETLRALCLRRTEMTPGALEKANRHALKEKLVNWWETNRAG